MKHEPLLELQDRVVNTVSGLKVWQYQVMTHLVFQGQKSRSLLQNELNPEN